MAGPKQQNRSQQGGRGFRYGRGRGGRSNRSNFKSHNTEDNDSHSPAKSFEPNAIHGRGGYRNVSSGGQKHDLNVSRSTVPTRLSVTHLTNDTQKKSGDDGKTSNKAHLGSSSKPKQQEDSIRSPQSLQFVPTNKSLYQGAGRVTATMVRSTLPAKLSAFQRLPGELRWKIYEHVFDVHRVEVLRLRDKNPENNIKRVHYRLYHRQLRPRDPKTHAAPSSEGRFTCPPLPIALLLTCRSIYRDTLCLFYSRMQFIFNTTRTVMRFLKITQKEAQMAIQHIELNHTMYSEPALLNFRWYKCMSDMAWYNACDDLTVYCKSLLVLHIDMNIRDWPISLQVGERWSLPLLAFARYGPRLDWVDIRLHMGSFKQDKLEKVAREIEEQIMDPTAFQMREDERLAKELAGPVKAKVLRLVF
ncbi:uncharacterized protein CDV56_102369 [Aspergillus thermomutatus]|uniref:DUF7730 domain-containing protein n=1 Tax=Aspergillus thermomutatus TaxID=41047 RepID=A0A397HXD1_ASPTH|nr:uncharacterized protein CDV56_102369 [Aspergillus thermomutatus]RHZ67895.1 hypothetical protein CDV56_102369 [Aspergillus thermomutatus]